MRNEVIIQKLLGYTEKMLEYCRNFTARLSVWKGLSHQSKIAQIDELSFRASAHTGVGIPRLNGNSYRNAFKKLGDCHTSDIGHWFAMTVLLSFCAI